jgi:prepilin peptidase CpaA
VSLALPVAAALGLVAAEEDLRRRSIPNWLTAAGAAGGLACSAANGRHGVQMAAAGLLVGFLLLLPFHWLRAMGGGDVKLLAAFGALLGPSGILLAAVFAAVFGAILAVAALAWKPRSRAIPYAPAIVLGAWVSLLGGGS